MASTPKSVKPAGAAKPKAKLTLEQSRAQRAARSAANKAAAKKTRPAAPAAPKAKADAPRLPGSHMLAADPLVDPKYTPLTPIVLESFLAALALTGNFTEVCEHLRLSPGMLQHTRRQDPEFKARWELAMSDAADHWEAEVARRAFKGVLEPVYQGGEMVGHIRKYSDRLAEMLIRAGRPDKYKPAPTQVQQTVQGTMTNINLTASLSPEQLEAELAARQATLETLAAGTAEYKAQVAK